ncbi:DUF1127 domain-containing protein [Mangrovibrevibacter kandeliae]|nr:MULTISPECIES: DUF1127 domain-containing protein [unclassified Aurantimonas]MCQ8781320.1 DUF1127 domain-containing protein [Aurantimonas sp. CSK15Z-1]MCW4114102.1 DUF1127 domain-containing protein [Aurantimonas sp. MSK8Z-1]
MFSAFASRFRRYQQMRDTMRQLQSMDDHQLADIGVQRGNIHHALRFGRF